MPSYVTIAAFQIPGYSRLKENLITRLFTYPGWRVAKNLPGTRAVAPGTSLT